MKYFIYLILLYVFLPFNSSVDLITILIFFIVFNEDERFALIFSFFAGILIDLYNPVYLGITMLIYLILVQVLLYVKKYINQSLPTIFTTFMVFYFTKIATVHLILSSPLRIQPIATTIIVFLPLFLVLNKLMYKVWIKT